MKKPETLLQQRIKKFLQYAFGGVWHKIHGDMYQDAGIGDLVGCCHGYYFNLEVKCPTNKKRKESQTNEIDKVNQNGGCGSYVTSEEEAYEVVRKYLKQKAVYLPEKSYETLFREYKLRSMDGSRNRKDPSNVKGHYHLVEKGENK